MSKKIDDGGPAFPGMRSYPLNPDSHFYGLTKRELYAFGALSSRTIKLDEATDLEALAEIYFKMADAMLAESRKMKK